MKNKRSLIFKSFFIMLSLISFLILFLGNNSNYYLFIYNSDNVSEEDKEYIKNYGDTLDGQVKIIDSKGVTSAGLMCQALKNSYSSISNNIKGIQIFGTKDSVPSFDIGFEINMGNDKIDKAYEDFVSDFFYSNFDSEMSCLKTKTGINSIFINNLNVSFKPRWKVARLPLKKDEFAPFIKKYFDYKEQLKSVEKPPIISFSNPILLESPVKDDMGYFIKEKIDKECGYLKNRQYRLYGLLEGSNKVTGKVEGDFIKENVEKENQQGIMDLFINCHGENDKFIKMIFLDDSYGNNKMTSFIDRSNVNNVLGNNYYTLTAWSCLIAQGLNEQNIIYDILRYKCVDAMAATTIISNNGTNNKASFEQSKNNNFYCFFYELFRSLNNGCSRSESFFNAQKLYSESVLNHKSDDLYQYHILNLLSYHYLGLL